MQPVLTPSLEKRVFLEEAELNLANLDEGQVRRSLIEITGQEDRDWEVKRNAVNELHTLADCGSVGWGIACTRA